jgi:hypothetical protein
MTNTATRSTLDLNFSLGAACGAVKFVALGALVSQRAGSRRAAGSAAGPLAGE